MKRTIGEVQDAELHRMEKVKRNSSTNDNRVQTLAEQLREWDLHEKLSDSEKASRMPWSDWATNVLNEMVYTYVVGRKKYISNLIYFRERTRFEELHRRGASLREIASIIESEMPDTSEF